MTGYFRHILFLLSLVLLLLYSNARAQTVELDLKEQALLQAAEDSLEVENYQYARQVFSQLLSLHNDELYFRFKYAVCLVYLNSDLDQAIDYLKIAAQSGKMPEAYYYLGLANHYRYMFDKAINNYNKFLQSDLSSKEKEILPVYRQIAMAENGKMLVEYAYMLNVIDNKNLTMSDFFYSYNLDNMGGRFVRKHPDFQTRYDRKREKYPIMFISTDNNYILFSSYGKRGKTGKDLYEVKRQADGNWGDAEILGKIINTAEDEDFAYLHPDGKQLFFCSKGHNSMGGYDIFRSQWNEKKGNWGIPRNMDFPINSPMDDMLYVNDSADNYAIFASRRDSENERVSIYKILIKKDPQKRKVESMQDLIKTSKLQVNLLAAELETRDEDTPDNQFETDDETVDTTNLVLALNNSNDDEISPELTAYQNQKTELDENLQGLNTIRDELASEQNQFKQLVADAWASEDSLLALAGMDAVKVYDEKLSSLNADVEAFESMLQELNLQNDEIPQKTVQTKLDALADNAERLVEDYEDFDLISALEADNAKNQDKLTNLKSEIEEIKQSLSKEREEGTIKDITDKAIASHEQVRKAQKKQIAELSELEYDYQSLQAKQDESDLALSLIKENKNNLKSVDESVEIPLADIQVAEQKVTSARLNRLNKIQREIQQKNNNDFDIEPWFEQAEYQAVIEESLAKVGQTKTDDFPESLIAEKPDLETALVERNAASEEIKSIKEQLKTADEEQKPALWKAMNEQISHFEGNNEIIEAYVPDSDLVAENTDVDPEQSDNSFDVNPEPEIKYPDAFRSNNERERFVRETKNSLNAVNEKRKETETNLADFNETQSTQLSQVKLVNSQEELDALRESQKEIIQQAIDLNNSVLDEEQMLNKVLSNELYRFTEGSPGFDSVLKGQIEEAVRLADESESFEISARNNENPIRKMSFLDKGNEKIREANQVLRQLSQDIAGVEIAAESSDKRPNTNTIKAIIRETNDELTQVEVENPFVNPVNQSNAPLIVEKDEQAREYAFQLTDSLFGTREVVRTKIKENPESEELAELRRQEDAIRFEIAEEVTDIYSQAQPVLNRKIQKNQETIEYLQDIGLINERQIPGLVDDIDPATYSANPNMTPIQIHRNITRLANHMNAQMELLQTQEALINTVRTNPSNPIPGAWFDLVNKMNRLAEPKIPVDKNFTDIQLETYEAAGIALPPSERKTKEKLENRIAKSEGKINEIQEAIAEIRNSETVDDRSLKQLEKLEEKQTKESVKQTEYKVERQGWYFNLKEKSAGDNPLVETVYSIADSLNQVASKQLEIIQENEPEPELKFKQLQYAHGLLIEANQLIQSVEMHERNEISDDALTAYIKTYRPESEDVSVDDELIAENNETQDVVDDTEIGDATDDIFDEQDENPQNDTDEFVDTEPDDTEDQITEVIDVETDLDDASEIENAEQNTNQNDIEQDADQTDSQDLVEADEVEDKNQENVSIEQQDVDPDDEQAMQTDNNTVISDDALYYRIQMVAYSRPLNDTAFRGISPVVDEQVPGQNIYRYLAGKFYNSNSWRNALPLVKNQGFTDAFPVAYLNRERISLARARDLRYLEKDLPAEFRILTATQDDFIAQQDETGAQVDVAAANQMTVVPVLEDNQSAFYSIQLGAFGRAVNQDNIRGVSADFYHREGNGYYKYYHGKYRSYDQALQEKGIVNRSIADAFIVTFSGGERVPRAEADAAIRNAPPIADTQEQDADVSSNGIRFRIQIGAFSNPISPEQLQNYREAFTPYPIGNINRGNITIYFIEGFESYETAGQALKIMVRPLVGDAFVTAWRGDTKITIREALQAE
ncbi:MAG: hypothetical protein PF448_01370 [Bacteroidales bacterium]|nr:hypothetical protein [Bacteroidales bacterium]